ncbi:MAG TPA: ABC transporter ATP-binding protein [Candidatus Dormibacteraeota bacterium]|nr:ABC transporter ATP-binding protein [Candidatus Dormibacteraeota bacterium]
MAVWRSMWADQDRLRSFTLDSAVLGRAWRFARPYRRRLVAYLALTAAGGVLEVLPALVIRGIVDRALPARSAGLLVALTTLLALLFVASTAKQIGARWLGLRIGSGIVLELRRALYDHLQRMPLAFFARAQAGRLQSRLNYDVATVEGLLTDTLSSALSDLVSLSFTLAAMLALNWRVTLVLLVLAPLVIVPAEWIGRRNRRLTKERMEHFGALNVSITERLSVSGALLVKLFGRFDADLASFTARAAELRRTAIQMEVLLLSLGAGLSLAGLLSAVVIYLAGGLAVIGGAVSLGTLIALATLAQRVYAPIVDLASTRINMITGLVGFERVFEVLDKPHAIADSPTARTLPRPERGHVRFDAVWFRYPAPAEVSIASMESRDGEGGPGELATEPSSWILRDLSFAAEAGTMTALVGPTGAGKTTLCHLVPRLYDATRGAVLVDGHDVRDLSLASLRAAIAMVPQDPHLFHESVLANLRLARPGATEREVADACRAAHIHELIDRLPDRYDTVVGERGYRFSGGEKQRLAIARALLKDPAILILDEATSHLDSETEALVQEALATLLRGRTSFVIAHRLSTIRQADQILVLEAGRIVDIGGHDDLLARGGLYADLHATQFRVA